MVSHAILGATLAYVNGGNPAAGGTAAVASEAAANYLAKQYDDGKTAIDPVTGLFEPNLLPEDVKTQIRDLTAAIDAVQACSGGACFTAGTLIETREGLKAVEQFEGGSLFVQAVMLL